MKTVLFASLTLLLAACTISGPRVSVKPIEIKPLEIEIGDGGESAEALCDSGCSEQAAHRVARAGRSALHSPISPLGWNSTATTMTRPNTSAW